MTTTTTTTTTTPPPSSIITDAVEFDDIFHEFNEDLDTEANEWPYLNNFYLNFEDQGQQNEDETLNRSSNTSQQQQQQHSTSAVVSTLKNENHHQNDAHEYFYGIPDYLSAWNSSFQVAFFCELRRYVNPIDFQDLQHLVLLTHQTTIMYLHEQLWRCFLQVGQGQLKQPFVQPVLSQDYSSNRTILSFWPHLVTTVMISNGLIPHDQHSQTRIQQDMYIHFIQNYLDQLEKQARLRRTQFDTILDRLFSNLEGDARHAFSDKIEDFLRRDESLSAMRFHFQRRIALLEYISMDRAYQLAYFQEKPTDLQLQIAKQICSLTYDKEKASQELVLLKSSAVSKKLLKSLNLLEISLPKSITTLSDPTIRERLTNNYQRIIQQAKADLARILTTAAQAKKTNAERIFDQRMAELWKNQHQYPEQERLTRRILTIIEQRQRNIRQCAERIYDLKSDFYYQAPPTAAAIIH